MTASRILLYFCLAFVAGIFLDSFFDIPGLLMPGILIFGLILISVFWRYKKTAVIGFCFLFSVLGIWKHQIAESQILNSKIQNYNDTGEKITLVGIVSEEPDIRQKSIKLIVNAKQLIINGQIRKISGKILVTTNRYPEYKYGDELEIVGKIKSPAENIEDFNYRDYLSKDGIFSEMSWPEINLTAKERGSPIYSVILSFKEKLRQVIYKNLSPPQSSVLGAVILGDKKQISEDLNNKLNVAGVRHITAISGMHITIIAGILISLLISFGLWRGQAFYISLILLFFYILMIGAPPSAVRAGIMGGIFLFGQKLGRNSVSSRAVIFAATAMLFQNPLLLKLDAGFQLSFLAVMGIIHLTPFFQNLFKSIPNSAFFPLKNLLSMTLAAQIFTLPILIYNFGYFSLIAPITNILIVPLLPFIMIFGFVFGLAGMIFEPLGWIFSWFSWILLSYIIKIIDIFSELPFAKIAVENIHWVWLIIFYSFLLFLIYRLREKEKLKFLNY